MIKKEILLSLILFFLLFASCKKKEEVSLYQELKDINELILSEVRVEKTFIIDDPNIRFKEIGTREGLFQDMVDWVKRKTSVGKRIGVYSFGTYFSAYIDLDGLQEEDIVFDPKNKKYTLSLPPIQIREWGRDFEIRTEHERVTSYRPPLTSQERTQAKNEAGNMLKKEIEQNGEFKKELILSAEKKGIQYFETLLSNWGYQAEIKFKEK